VKLVVTSDAGWMAGAFQGYGSLATQVWLEQAGLDGWTRLSAATIWPARVLGRKQLDFAPGAPADFVAVTADPLQSAEHLKRVSLVVRSGKVVDRERLLPDLTRTIYPKSH
jgi:imidazolonepropionase-like amidohydrolase